MPPRTLSRRSHHEKVGSCPDIHRARRRTDRARARGHGGGAAAVVLEGCLGVPELLLSLQPGQPRRREVHVPDAGIPLASARRILVEH